jgi:HEPN domain-containing protein
MPRPELPEPIGQLLAKAAQDEYVLDKTLVDDDAPIEIYGFHAQQTAEKLLKAVLLGTKVVYPFTHRLTELLDLGRSHGIDFPEAFEELRYLTPFAVEFRYDVFPPEEEEPLDKAAVRKMLKDLRHWVESFIQSNA